MAPGYTALLRIPGLQASVIYDTDPVKNVDHIVATRSYCQLDDIHFKALNLTPQHTILLHYFNQLLF